MVPRGAKLSAVKNYPTLKCMLPAAAAAIAVSHTLPLPEELHTHKNLLLLLCGLLTRDVCDS